MKHGYFNTISIVLSFFFSFYGYSQNNKKEDSTSIISYTDKIIIKTNLDSESYEFYSSKRENNPFRSFYANNDFRLTFSLDYEFIGISIALPQQLLGDQSSITNYSFLFFLGNWTQGIQYKTIKGHSYELFNNLDQNEITVIQNAQKFKTIYWEGSTSYIINPKFSLRNVAYNTEWQQKSAGSFIPTLKYGFSRLKLKTNQSKFYQDDYNIELASSYYYTWVIHKNWFISPFISPSFGIQFSREITKEVNKTTYFPISFAGGTQIGYSSKKVIFGINIDFQTKVYNYKKVIEKHTGFAKLYLGYRIPPTKKVKKTFDWINQKLGFNP